jgi:hypothetical protein
VVLPPLYCTKIGVVNVCITAKIGPLISFLSARTNLSKEMFYIIINHVPILNF